MTKSNKKCAKVVLLAGGLGTRIAEKSDHCPKPMIEVGGKPMLWHIMNTYAAHGFKHFIIALGYKAEVVKEYFANFHRHNTDMQVDLGSGHITLYGQSPLDWKVDLIFTGESTQTGSRIKRIQPWVGDERFMLTYGDGVSDVNIGKLWDFHESQGRKATLTAVRPPARYGSLEIENNQVMKFSEKPRSAEGWINGGFFVLEPEVFDYIETLDDTIWERSPLEGLAKDGELSVYKHGGFWQSMDTLRDHRYLESLWSSGSAPWKVWDDQKINENELVSV